jgi:taurine dioxygenase
MRVRVISPNIGAEITNVDLSGMAPSELGELRRLLLKHGVLHILDQHNLTREDMIKMARGLGTIDLPANGDESLTEIVRLHHDATAPPTENIWHSDMSFRLAPPMGSILRAVVLPSAGGDTIFANMRAALSYVPPQLQDVILGMTATHDIAKHADALKAPNLRQLYPPRSQPIVHIHPETGERSLFVNAAYTTKIDKVSNPNSLSLLNHLLNQVLIPEIQCRIRWQPGSVVFWDNRSTQHYAVGDYMPETRIMERVSLAGEPLRRVPFTKDDAKDMDQIDT